MSVHIKLKRAIIPILVVILFLFSLFFIDVRWWGLREINNFAIIIYFIIMVSIFEVLMIFFIKSYFKSSIIKLKNHFVIIALKERNFKDILIHFPLIIIFEEILFRLYVFTFMLTFFGFIPALIISALIFSFYHVHTWFEFNDKRITYSFVLTSGILGLILGGVLYYFGLLFCIMIHFTSVLGLFYYIKIKLNHKSFN